MITRLLLIIPEMLFLLGLYGLISVAPSAVESLIVYCLGLTVALASIQFSSTVSMIKLRANVMQDIHKNVGHEKPTQISLLLDTFSLQMWWSSIKWYGISIIINTFIFAVMANHLYQGQEDVWSFFFQAESIGLFLAVVIRDIIMNIVLSDSTTRVEVRHRQQQVVMFAVMLSYIPFAVTLFSVADSTFTIAATTVVWVIIISKLLLLRGV